MKVGIDVSSWHNGRGFGRFTRELVTAMLSLPDTGHRLTLFTDQPLPAGLEADIVTVAQGRPVAEAAVADSSRSPLDTLRFSGAAWRAGLDVLFYPAVYSWFPCPLGLPNLVTFHDAIAEHFPRLVFPDPRARRLWNLKIRLARWQATRFLTVSAAARAEIVTHVGIDPRQIDVTTEGPSPAFRPRAATEDLPRLRQAICGQFGLPGASRFYVYVGGFAPHKNLQTLIRAFALLKSTGHPDLHLLLVGDRGSHGFSSNIAELDQLIAAAPGLAPSVHFTGFVADELLSAVLSSAIALVLPSLSEGFGLPAVEAMACGTPVLASAAGSLPEIVGDGGRFFQPLDYAELSALLHELAGDEAVLRDLRNKALQRSRLYTWEKAAELAFNALERCVIRQ